jgi:beta-barrel assembly-enhancing protease
MNRTNPRAWPAAFALTALLGCASTKVADVKPGYKPDSESTDESGLWYQFDKLEKVLVASPDRVTDPVLQSYLEGLSCKLAPDICKDMRIYIVRDSSFNASMAPNGLMLVHTGLLLRTENEAQLAAVIGHEIGHYRKRHSLENWRKAKNVGGFLNSFGVVAGGSAAGVVALLGAYASLTAFSRDQEREADLIGFDSVKQAGLDVNGPWKLWEFVHEETKHYPKGLFSQMFASHPADTERKTNLRKLAGTGGGDPGLDRYQAATQKWFLTWVEDELSLRAYTQTEVLLKRLASTASKNDPASVQFALGELYRKRLLPGDLQRALDAYQKASKYDTVPNVCFRNLGLTLNKLNRPVEAKKAFAEYLKREPEAEDAAMIRSYL